MEGNDLSGHEAFIAAVAPHFWSHVPMTVAQLNRLNVVEGINCAILSNPKSSSDNPRDFKFVPVSRCELLGYITNVEVKSNGSMAYVLDDGTGTVDCIDWKTCDNDMYYLPNLFGENSNERSYATFSLGDLVRIQGKIKCVSIFQRTNAGDEATTTTATTVNREPREIYGAIREIQVVDMEHINQSRTSNICNLDAESHHWKKCEQSVISPTCTSGLQTPLDVLDILGQHIQLQVRDRQGIPCADDKLMEYKLFTPSCKCSMDYKYKLLYCHCKAKVVQLDIHFTFRDEVLKVLVAKQESCAKKLAFKYKEIRFHPHLKGVAAQQVKTVVEENTLFRKTFSALRDDGIVHLQDERTDSYLLISRSHVLEPYVRDFLKEKSGIELYRDSQPNLLHDPGAPPYLTQRANKDRLDYIKRCLA